MEALLETCAGLDVHKKTIQVCVNRLDAKGRTQRTYRTFATMTRDILALGDWLDAQGVVRVGMESTGVLWKPIYNLLESRFELVLCNAHHLKQVPGRKTDLKDCAWIADLLQHGLVRGSFVPPRPHRELRELTRHRVQLKSEWGRTANRLHKTLEDANIKLGAVASDILGVSGRAMLQALQRGETDPEALADLARGRLRAKLAELRLALEGRLTDHHRFMLDTLLQHIEMIETMMERLDGRIEHTLARLDREGGELPFAEAISLLETIPGIARVSAQAILAEIGTDMGRFPAAGNLASWAGRCPGNHESAGRRKKGTTTHGNRWLARALGVVAWSAVRSQKCYFRALFRRLAGRRGRKRAIVAVSHAMLVTIYAMLRDRRPYQDLGPDHFERLAPERLRRYYTRRLEALGFDVQLTQTAA